MILTPEQAKNVYLSMQLIEALGATSDYSTIISTEDERDLVSIRRDIGSKKIKVVLIPVTGERSQEEYLSLEFFGLAYKVISGSDPVTLVYQGFQPPYTYRHTDNSVIDSRRNRVCRTDGTNANHLGMSIAHTLNNSL